MFWIFGPEARGILAPWPGIEPTPPALESKMLTLKHWGSPAPTYSSGSGSAISFWSWIIFHSLLWTPIPIVAVLTIQYCVYFLSTPVDSECLEAKLTSTNPSIWVLEGSLKHLIWKNKTKQKTLLIWLIKWGSTYGGSVFPSLESRFYFFLLICKSLE